MPSYLYRCRNKECNHEFSDLESISSEPQTICPKCGQPKLERVPCYTGPVVYNGTGWTKGSGAK